MEKIKNLSIISLVLILCTSCVQTTSLGESDAPQFSLAYTGFYLIIMGLFCNQLLGKVILKDSGIYSGEYFNPTSTQINFFIGFICMSITEIIMSYQHIDEWRMIGFSLGGFIVGMIIGKIICNCLSKGFQDELNAFREKATDTYNAAMALGKTPDFDVNTVTQAYSREHHPVEIMSRFIGRIALLCILAGGVCLYFCVKDLF